MTSSIVQTKSPIAQAILADLSQHPNSTNKEIAARIQTPIRAVASSICWLRGEGLVTDGTVVEVYASGAMPWARKPPGETRWSLGDVQLVNKP